MPTSLLSPAYKLTIGSRVIDTTDEPKASTFVSIEVALDMNTPADSAALVIGRADGLHPAREDDVKIELGYHDDAGTEQVMAGTVVSVAPGLTTTRVVVHSAAEAMLRIFMETT